MDLVRCKICGERHSLGFCPTYEGVLPPPKPVTSVTKLVTNETRPVTTSCLQCETLKTELRGLRAELEQLKKPPVPASERMRLMRARRKSAT
jgi:hypothetical protein